MKKILNIILLCISATNCNSQTQILDISQDRGTDNLTGAYYKDLNGYLNPFVGTYVYTSGNTSLKIVLQKKTMSSVNDRYFHDYLVGEYRYVNNGIEVVSTLNNLSQNFSNAWNYNIGGNLIISQGNTGCFDCVPNEKAWKGGLVDSSTGNTAELIIRRVTVNGAPAIKIWIMWRMRYKNAIDSALPNPSFDGGYYTLMKQL
jgi:hypothetical protein